MDIFQEYKPIRNKIALLDREDALQVIWAYCQFLQNREFQFPRNIEVHNNFIAAENPRILVSEWTLEVLAKEVLLNCGVGEKKGHTLRRWKILAEIINELRDFEDRIYGSHGGRNVFIEMLRIAHRQFTWQINKPNSSTAMRYYKIFNCKGIDQICLEKIGLNVFDFYACYLSTFGHYLDSYRIPLPITSSIKQLPSKKFERFFSVTCKSLKDVTALLAFEQKYDTDFAYAYNSFRAYPIVQLENSEQAFLACPIPTLLFWRVTSGLYYELYKDPRFASEFGDAIQDYVGDVLREACLSSRIQILAEREYGDGRARKRTVDWIATDSTAALFIECKAKRLSLAAKTSLFDTSALESDLAIIASAVVQTYKTIVDYRSGKYQHFPFDEKRKIYPLIVTLENWFVFGPDMFKRLDAAVASQCEIAKIPKSFCEEMSYSVMAMTELESAIQIMSQVPVAEVMDGKLKDGELRQWIWQSYLGEKFPKVPRRMLFEDEFEKLCSGLSES